MSYLGLLCLLLAYCPVPTLSIKHWEESTQRWKYTFTNVVYLLRFSQWRLKRWKITGKPSHAIAMLMISFCLVNHITCLSCYFYIYFYNIFTYTVSQSLLFLFTNNELLQQPVKKSVLGGSSVHGWDAGCDLKGSENFVSVLDNLWTWRLLLSCSPVSWLLLWPSVVEVKEDVLVAEHPV